MDKLRITLSGPQGCGKTSLEKAMPGSMEWLAVSHGRTSPLPYDVVVRGNDQGHPLSVEDEAALRAKAEELDKIAATLGEADDPFAAWESLALIITEHRAMRAALANADNLLLTVHGPGVEAFSHELNRLLADISELPEPCL